MWDLAYAITRRYVDPLEQHVHSFLELLPLMGVSFVTILYWDQFLALFGLGLETAAFRITFERSSASAGVSPGVLHAIVMFLSCRFARELLPLMQVSTSACDAGG